MNSIVIAFFEGVARRVGEELADRGISQLRKRHTERPKTDPPPERSPSETPDEKALT